MICDDIRTYFEEIPIIFIHFNISNFLHISCYFHPRATDRDRASSAETKHAQKIYLFFARVSFFFKGLEDHKPDRLFYMFSTRFINIEICVKSLKPALTLPFFRYPFSLENGHGSFFFSYCG